LPRGEPVAGAPLGFDAGDDNVYRYARNSPTTATDPTGLQPELTVSEAQAPQLGYWGAFIWPVNWGLKDNAKEGGFVIQRIEVTFDVTNQQGQKVKHPSDDGHWNYYEAWRIDKGKSSTTNKEVSDYVKKVVEGLLAAIPGQQLAVNAQIARLQAVRPRTPAQARGLALQLQRP
jgi:hypothetical protein